MKVIDIPKLVKCKLVVKQPDGSLEEVEQTLTFSGFLTGACDGYKKFAQGPAMARQFNKIMDIVESMKGKSVQFEDTDFKVVEAAVNSAEWTHVRVNRASIPFYDAVRDAEDVKIPGKPKKK